MGTSEGTRHVPATRSIAGRIPTRSAETIKVCATVADNRWFPRSCVGTPVWTLCLRAPRSIAGGILMQSMGTSNGTCLLPSVAAFLYPHERSLAPLGRGLG